MNGLKTTSEMHTYDCLYYKVAAGNAYLFDLLPKFDLDTRHGKDFYKKYQFFSFMMFGHCDTCEEFWNNTISLHLGE